MWYNFDFYINSLIQLPYIFVAHTRTHTHKDKIKCELAHEIQEHDGNSNVSPHFAHFSMSKRVNCLLRVFICAVYAAIKPVNATWYTWIKYTMWRQNTVWCIIQVIDTSNFTIELRFLQLLVAIVILQAQHVQHIRNSWALLISLFFAI